MNRVFPKVALLLCAVLGLTAAAHAHIGSKDVYQQVNAGPYKLYVTIRTPNVIPGVAALEVRTSGATVTAIQITPIPLTGEGATHPPTSDAMKASSIDPAFFTGSLWLMESGSWQVRLEVDGAAGKATAGVPVAAAPLSILPMQRSLGITLAALGLLLVLGMTGIVAAAVRESRLDPETPVTPGRRRRALYASIAAFALLAAMVYFGNKWWGFEARGYASDVYRPLSLTPMISGNTLTLEIGSREPGVHRRGKQSATAKLLADHGHLMHLYAIRQPGMDAVYHLHPAPNADGDFQTVLPTMPAGDYKLYADIVHASGFPETLTATLTVPPSLPPAPLDPEDAAAHPPALDSGELGPSYKLPDGYTMIWDRPAALTANTAYTFNFRLVGPDGKPAADMQPYLGMAGHAAFVKADGTTFAHTHPDGSAAMPAVMLASAANAGGPQPNSGVPTMAGMDMTPAMPAEPVTAEVGFPYGFPSAGRYRIFIQMKHNNTVETGVFDTQVQ